MVKGQQQRARRSPEQAKVRAYLRAAEVELRGLGIRPRTYRSYPFDTVGLATVSKVFSLAQACLRLLASHHPDEAFGLSRSIVECANNLRYLTADPAIQDKRTRDFVNYAKATKAFWAHYSLEQFRGKKVEKEIRSYMKQQRISADAKPARRHWSGLNSFVWDVVNIDHPLDGPVTAKHKKVAYAADYFQTSAFVHCSLPAIDNYYATEGVPFRVSDSSGLHETAQSALFIIAIYVHSSICYALFGLGVDRGKKLDALFQKAIRNLQPVPLRHARKSP